MSLESIVIGITSVTIIFLGSNNISLRQENNDLRDKATYIKSLSDANATKESIFKSKLIKIEENYNATVKDLNTTDIGGTINFGN